MLLISSMYLAQVLKNHKIRPYMLDIIIIDEYDDGENIPYLKICAFSCFLSDGPVWFDQIKS